MKFREIIAHCSQLRRPFDRLQLLAVRAQEARGHRAVDDPVVVGEREREEQAGHESSGV